MSAERATALVRMAADAMVAARNKIGIAADTAEEIDRMFRQAEDAGERLPRQADEIRTIADYQGLPFDTAQEEQADLERRRGNAEEFLGKAQTQASNVDMHLEFAQNRIPQLREELGAADIPIKDARAFLDELDNLPPDPETPAGAQSAPSAGLSADGEPLTTATLRDRLTKLETAVETAKAGVNTTETRLGAARINAQRLSGASVSSADIAASAELVEQVSGKLTADVSALRGDVGSTYTAGTEASQTAAKADELATAMRAGLNPTPLSQQTTPGTAGNDPRPDWAAGRDLGPSQDR